jgi:hypothetical protein
MCRAFQAGRVLSGLTLAAAVIAGATILHARRAGDTLYVTVMDGTGKPVIGLTASDFTVAIDGTQQEVLAAAPATGPVSAVLLTDRLGLTSLYLPYDVHQALGNFVKGIRAGAPDSQFALTTFDGSVIEVTKLTAAPAELDRAIGKLSSNTTDAVLLDAVVDACRTLNDAPSQRRVIFVLLADYRPDQSNVQNSTLSEILRLSKAAIWGIEARSPQGGNYANAAREIVLGRDSQWSGGMVDIVSSPTALASSAKHLAQLVTSQYAVTYGPGGGTARSQITVGVTRDGLKVLAPMWTAQ